MTESPANDVALRRVAQTDLPIFFAHQKDPVACHMAAFTRSDSTDRDAFMAHWARILNDDTVTVRTILCDGQVAGSVASYVDETLGEIEVTYWVGREFWGSGIATQALARFLKIQTRRPIYARAATDNVASIRVLRKCGFEISGHTRGFANARGEEIDEVVMVRH